MAPLAPGTMLGPYRIIEQVGKGGMATVYKAHHAALSRFVAVKILPDFLAEEPGFKERFQQEAVAVAKLRHPNILAVYDHGEQDGITFIVNEFVDGGTLDDQLGHSLPVEYTAETLGPIASALDYAHARGILHRDIKPSNILMARDGTPILADFGLAKILEPGPGGGLTMAGMVVGTPEYMSPEQCAGEDLTPAADVYSLAVVGYQMLTGKLPFSAATPAAVIMAQLHNSLPPPRSVNPDITPDVEAALLKGLAKTAGDRYKTCSLLVKGLVSGETPSLQTRVAESTPAPVSTADQPAPAQNAETVTTPAPEPAAPKPPRPDWRPPVVESQSLATAGATGGQAYAPPAVPAGPQTYITSPATAMAAMITGILSVVCCGLGVILGPIAFVLGTSALGKIKASQGAMAGSTVANAGRILGVVGFIVSAISVVVYFANNKPA